VPLNIETIDGLLHSSAVLFKAGREVLSLNKPEDFERPLITVEWLSASLASTSPAARPPQPGPDALYRGLADSYADQSNRDPAGLTKGQKEEASQGKAVGRSSSTGKAAGGMGGGMMGGMGMGGSGSGMGGFGMGGMGGVGMGGMGRPGGMMGGYGGMGMGAMRGGMMNGMGGYGSMGPYGIPGAAPQSEGVEQSATVQLHVSLPDTMPPLADEFLREVVKNLQNSLLGAHEAYAADLRRWLNQARDQRHAAEAALEDVADDSPATRNVREQLDTIVDLSALNPQMPLKDAIEVLRKSVDPPLNIVVLWNDLSMHLSVEPTTPSNIDGMVPVRLGTALDLVVKGIPNRMGKGGPTWKMKDNVIVIGTVVALEESRDSVAKPKIETDAVNLGGQRSELARRIQALELDLAGIDARQKAIQEQIVATQATAGKRLATDSVTVELRKLLRTSEENLGQLKKAADAGRVGVAELAQAEESVAKARIDMARRQDELTRQAGGGQLEELTKELSHLAIDKAEKEAQLQIVRKQLDEVQRQLAQAFTFDPEAARLRMTQEALDITGRRITELQTRMANLQPPTVNMIGAN
jgi:hypothetical protein